MTRKRGQIPVFFGCFRRKKSYAYQELLIFILIIYEIDNTRSNHQNKNNFLFICQRKIFLSFSLFHNDNFLYNTFESVLIFILFFYPKLLISRGFSFYLATLSNIATVFEKLLTSLFIFAAKNNSKVMYAAKFEKRNFSQASITLNYFSRQK